MTSSVTVTSDDFLMLLSAAKTTVYSGKEADPAMSSIYLTTARADGEEGGEVDVLVAVSSDGIIAGQTTIEADGQLPHPILVDLKSNSWVTSLVKNAQTNMKKLEGKGVECTVELTVVGSDSGSGGFLQLQTKTDSVPGTHDNRGIVPLADYDYPIGDVMNDLRPTERKEVISSYTDAAGTQIRESLPDGPVQGFSEAQIDLMKAISGAIKEPVLQYDQGHSANRRTLVCGTRWRGTVPGYEFNPAEADEPQVEIIEVNPDKD